MGTAGGKNHLSGLDRSDHSNVQDFRLNGIFNLISKDNQRMILYPNAKINLGLRILEKRRDGYHDIETLFLPIGLCDILEIADNEEDHTKITITGIELDSPGNDNLVMKAWNILNREFGIPPVTIHLHKIIPVGAGLGGGSADAAFMLKGLSRMFDCNLPEERLEEFAAEIGSDCAFFIKNQPAIGTGRGEILETVKFDPGDYEILLVNPAIHIGSGEAYSGVVPEQPGNRLKDLLSQPVVSWQHSIQNDFERSVFAKYPEIRNLKNKLLKMGAIYASMSGSGSSVYGLFAKGSLDSYQSEFGPWFCYRGNLKRQA